MKTWDMNDMKTLALHVGDAKARTARSWNHQVGITDEILRKMRITSGELEDNIMDELATYARETWPASQLTEQVQYAIEKITDTANDEFNANRTPGCTLETLRIIHRRRMWAR